MTKMKHRVLAAVMALAMLLSLTMGTGLTAYAEMAGDEGLTPQLDSPTRTTPLKIEDTTPSEYNNLEGWEWDKNTRTLTLNNFYVEVSTGYGVEIATTNNTTILLKGVNAIVNIGNDNAFRSSARLAFGGTGELLVGTDNSRAMYLEDSILINSGTIDAGGSNNATGSNGAGIYLESGKNITITGGKVTAGGSAGVYANGGILNMLGGSLWAEGNAANGLYAGRVVMEGGTLWATTTVHAASQNALFVSDATSGVKMTGGALIAKSSGAGGAALNKAPQTLPNVYKYRLSDNGSFTSGSYSWVNTDTYVEILSPKTLYFHSPDGKLYLETDPWFPLLDEEAVEGTDYTGSYTGTPGKLTLNNFSYTSEARRAIQFTESATLELIGENSIQNTGTYEGNVSGIHAQDKGLEFTVTGLGSLTVTAAESTRGDSSALRSNHFKMNSGNVTLNAGRAVGDEDSSVALAVTAFDISGGTLKAVAGEAESMSLALISDGASSITGGTVIAQSGNVTNTSGQGANVSAATLFPTSNVVLGDGYTVKGGANANESKTLTYDASSPTGFADYTYKTPEGVPAKYAKIAVPDAPDGPVVTKVVISPASASVAQGKTKAFKATVSGTGSFNKAVAWSVSGNKAAKTKIDKNGVLTVASGEKSNKLVVTATSKGKDANGKTVSKKANVIVIKKGTKFTSGGCVYKVTTPKTNGKGAVSLVKAAKGEKITNLKVPKTVKYKGVKYKVTTIAPKAFYKNKTLKTVTIAGNITKIGDKAFKGCTKLTKVTVGDKVTKLGNSVFYGCKKLKTVTIGKGLKSMGDHNFCHNKATKTIIIKSTKLTKVGKHNLHNHQKTKIKVPKSKVKAYAKLFNKQGVHDAKVVKIK